MSKVRVQFIPPLNFHIKIDTVDIEVEGQINIKELEDRLIEASGERKNEVAGILRYLTYGVDDNMFSGKEGTIKEGQTVKVYLTKLGG